MAKPSKFDSSLQHMDDELSKAKHQNNFQTWLFSQIYPYLKGNILELGSGLGSVSSLLIKKYKRGTIYLSDSDEDYVNDLKIKFNKFRNVKIAKINATKKNDFKVIPKKIDTIFAVNVLEHIKNDQLVINNVYDSLNDGGRFIVLVPAHPYLYNKIDKAVGHYRRYTKQRICKLAKKSGFNINKIFYFNAVSILGWFLSGKIFNQSSVNESNLSLLNKLIPTIAKIEKIFNKKIGISIIAILDKKSE